LDHAEYHNFSEGISLLRSHGGVNNNKLSPGIWSRVISHIKFHIFSFLLAVEVKISQLKELKASLPNTIPSFIAVFLLLLLFIIGFKNDFIAKP
jgi:hypothetical protein